MWSGRDNEGRGQPHSTEAVPWLRVLDAFARLTQRRDPGWSVRAYERFLAFPFRMVATTPTIAGRSLELSRTLRIVGCRLSRAREGSWCPLAHCRSEDPASPGARSAGGCARDVGTVRHLCRRDDVSASKTLQHAGASRGPPKYFDEWRKGPEGGRKNSPSTAMPTELTRYSDASDPRCREVAAAPK